MKYKFNKSVVGGTFDRFHEGHKKLLETAFSDSEFVTIGISTEKLYKHKLLAQVIENYKIREHAVKEFLNKNNFEKRAEIIAIEDIYGTTNQEKDIDAIFVTDDNIKAAELINKKRIENAFTSLEIIIVPFVKGNDGQAISSERIRKGEIDREGFVYATLFEYKSLYLPEKLRAKLHTPIGTVTKDVKLELSKYKNVPMFIAVGDIVTFLLAEAGAQADLSVIDFKTRRHELKNYENNLLESITKTAYSCVNKAGIIDIHATNTVSKVIEIFFKTGKKQSIKVSGEEDLLTLPAILLAPLDSVVIYGQYNEGAVFVLVTEQKKKQITEIVRQFETLMLHKSRE